MTATISVTQLAELKQSGRAFILLDVRTPAEFGDMHVPFARNVPLTSLSCDEVKSLAADGSEIYLICQGGTRGKQACEKLRAAGLTSVVNVEGGTKAWESAGLPLVRGKKAISLERQVRIAAGSLVVIGSALGILVHPAWIGLSAFVGAGLVFAGVTDTCGMAMMLAFMPWNRANRTPEKSSQPSCSL